MALTTTAQIDPAVQVFYDRVLLRAAYPKLVHLKFAQHARLDKKHGNTYKWRRYAHLTDATVPLTEGETPPGQQLSKTDLTVQVSQYGDYVHITDLVDLTVEDPVLTIAADLLGKQMGKTFDSLMRDILAACASQTDAAGGSNGKSPTEITTADIDTVVKTLLNNDADLITEIVKAEKIQSLIRNILEIVLRTENLTELLKSIRTRASRLASIQVKTIQELLRLWG